MKHLQYDEIKIGNLYHFKIDKIYDGEQEQLHLIFITKLHGYSFEGIIANSKILKDILPRYDFYNLQ